MFSAPPIKGSAKEAIKDTGPELVTEDDDAEIEQAIEEGNKTDEIITKAKVKTKSHLKGAFKGLGKKMAGFRGDVAVDGKERMVCVFLPPSIVISLLSRRRENQLTEEYELILVEY